MSDFKGTGFGSPGSVSGHLSQLVSTSGPGWENAIWVPFIKVWYILGHWCTLVFGRICWLGTAGLPSEFQGSLWMTSGLPNGTSFCLAMVTVILFLGRLNWFGITMGEAEISNGPRLRPFPTRSSGGHLPSRRNSMGYTGLRLEPDWWYYQEIGPFHPDFHLTSEASW